MKNKKPFIIAELSGNHKQSLKRALRLTDTAASIGADAIKLQTFKPEEMTLNIRKGEFLLRNNKIKGIWRNKTLYEIFKKAQTPWAWHKKIFGFQETENWEETALNIKGCRLKMPNSELHFEIISPMDKKGDVYDFIQLNGEGLHHIGLKNIAEGELSQHLKKLLDTDNKDDLKKLAGHSSYVSPQQVGGVTFYLSN